MYDPIVVVNSVKTGGRLDIITRVDIKCFTSLFSVCSGSRFWVASWMVVLTFRWPTKIASSHFYMKSMLDKRSVGVFCKIRERVVHSFEGQNLEPEPMHIDLWGMTPPDPQPVCGVVPTQ